MADYSLEDLGHVVKLLRRERGLTQEELGTEAGYGRGAGVSISRLENGRLEPTAKLFAGIAGALGVSVDELGRRASERNTAHQRGARGKIRSQEDRIADIVRASERRKQIAAELDAFNRAKASAEHAFLMTFRDIAARVSGAPAPVPTQLSESEAPETDQVKAEAAYQIRFTQYGVSQALAQPAGSATVGGAIGGAAAAYVAFTEAVALGTAPLGATISGLAGASAALNGLRSAMGVGRFASRVGGPAGGMNLLAAVAVGTVVATVLDRQATANRIRKQQESNAKLAAAEADIAANQANIETLLDIMPRATEVLDYVAVHVGHALTRWSSLIGEGAVRWNELPEYEQQRYQDFVTITAAQLAVTTIDLQELATSRDSDLEQATALADQILIQSERAITSRV